MSVTITLSEDLSARLQRRAAAERMSIDEFAVRVLDDAAGRPCDAEDWNKLNVRRLALIRKRFAGKLTKSDERELAQLQEAADRQLEQLDQRMLDDLERMEAAAQQLHADGE